jgi:hypothetical protein
VQSFSTTRDSCYKRCLGRVTSSPRLSAEKLEGENRGPFGRNTGRPPAGQTQNSPARSLIHRPIEPLPKNLVNERPQALDGLRDGRLKRATSPSKQQCGQRCGHCDPRPRYGHHPVGLWAVRAVSGMTTRPHAQRESAEKSSQMTAQGQCVGPQQGRETSTCGLMPSALSAARDWARAPDLGKGHR